MRPPTEPSLHDAVETASPAFPPHPVPGDCPGDAVDPAVLHDAGNALTAARLYAQVLRRRLSASPCDDGEALKAVQTIETNVAHAARLLEQGLRRRQ